MRDAPAIVRDALILKSILEVCCDTTEQPINYATSHITFNPNIASSIEEQIQHILQIPIKRGVWDYLGFLLSATTLVACYFNHLMAKLNNKIKGWKCKALLFVGRATFLQSILVSVFLYTMHYIHLLVSILNFMEKKF